MSLDLELELTPAPTRKLILLPSGRAIKSAFASLKPESKGFLPKLTTIDEFFDNLFLYYHPIQIDQINRQLLLHEAYISCDKSAKLGFDKEFLRFLSMSEFLDRFFSELNGELVELDDIETSDTYAEYSEHLEILKKISSEYIKLLDEKLFHDKKYSKPQKVNSLFIDLIDSIDVYIEGVPTNKELHALYEISKTKKVMLFVQKNRFSDKLLKKLLLFGIDLNKSPFGAYLVNLNNGAIEAKQESKKHAIVISSALSQRVYQVGFVFYMIESFISDGFAPEDICIVLPDESFIHILKPYDTMRNLNFAMGESVSKSRFFAKLSAIRDYVCKGDEEAKQKIDYYNCAELLADEVELEFLVTALAQNEPDELKEIVKNELLKLSSALKDSNQSFENWLWLFTDMIGKHSLDDVGGGKITVVGPLESRGSSFKAIIIVDFNEQKVPRSDDKDLFLNAKIRLSCGLPTAKERDDLQCFYYQRMVESAEAIAICYVKNEKESPSHLLGLIEHTEGGFTDDDATYVLQKLLLKDRSIAVFANDDDTVYSIKKISASSLRDFLECKKRYYLKYIKKISEHVDDKELKASQMGTLFHFLAMKIINQNCGKPTSIELKNRFTKEIKSEISKSSLAEFTFEAYLMLSRLEQFFEFESKRLQNYTPKLIEQEFAINHNGIDISGKIDRVDIGENGMISILDYKLKNIVNVDSKKNIENKPDEIVDFQLEIYLLAVMDIIGIKLEELDEKVLSVGYYDVYNARILVQNSVLEKLNLLVKILADLSVRLFRAGDFEMCKKKSTCRYCIYKEICGR